MHLAGWFAISSVVATFTNLLIRPPPPLGSGLPCPCAYTLGFQLFRDVLGVKTISCGVTFSLPQLGHLTFRLARSARVSVTSKPFSQLSHMNSYLGMRPLP